NFPASVTHCHWRIGTGLLILPSAELRPAILRRIRVSMNGHVRMFLADDDPHLAAVLRDHLDSYDQFELVGSALSAEEALEELGRRPVDVLLLDIKLPRMSGLEALSHFKLLKPKLKIVVITSLTPGEAELLAIKAGADGYVCKEGGFAQFL